MAKINRIELPKVVSLWVLFCASYHISYRGLIFVDFSWLGYLLEDSFDAADAGGGGLFF